MKETIEKTKKEFELEMNNASSIKELNNTKTKYFGKQGLIPEIANQIKNVEKDEKKVVGQLLNDLKQSFSNHFSENQLRLESKELADKIAKEWIDITLPSTKLISGVTHPLIKVIDEIEDLFVSMGYDVVEGPEIESDYYNFEKLNIAKEHPARDMQDSFYITAEMLLRTQTSPVQARTMIANEEKGPLRIICPGKVYRSDNDDMTHSHQFTQIEGLVVDKNISIAHLKGTLEVLVKQLFGEKRKIRLRPSFFPFTEPSLEVDVSCFKCGGAGCSICKQTGWIEILGSGMVHPNVLRDCGYDPEVYSGFAFGMGPERIAMLKYGINDIRHFYTNNLNFLNNFDRHEKGDINESK